MWILAASGSNYTVVAANAVTGGTVYASGLAGLSLTAGSITIPGTAFPASVTNAGQANTWLQSNPQTLYYQSTGYTEADDIAVSLETHQQTVLVLDGTENWLQQPEGSSNAGFLQCSIAKYGAGSSTHYAISTVASPSYSYGGSGVFTDGNALIFGAAFGKQYTVETWKAYLATQYAAGTPVTIVYQLATPITYAHPAVVLEAATGDQPTYTVTGQSGGTVSVSLKPFQDGGHAKTADNAQQLDGLTLLAIKESMTPVGYIFSWAPVDDGPDLSTPAKVAEYFGFGTWQAYGAGQVLVGVDSGQTEFATVGQTGGEKTHTLSEQELPEIESPVKYTTSGNFVNLDDVPGTSGSAYKVQWSQVNADAPQLTVSFGSGQAHNNLQPYVVVYRWQRVA